MFGKFENDFVEIDIQEKVQNNELSTKFEELPNDEIDYLDKNTADYNNDDLKALYEEFNNSVNISDEEIKYLDNNTIDTDFLPCAKDSEGKDIDPKIAQFRSPFADQENNDCDQERERYGKENFMPDSWKPTNIEKGSVLYQLGRQEGTRSPYFTDEKTVNSCINPETGKVDFSVLKAKLQINDSDNSKNTLSSYIVNDEMKATEGNAIENTQYGAGGGKQYFVLGADQLRNNGSKKSGDNI